jgi:type I restriction enzyme S subunit
MMKPINTEPEPSRTTSGWTYRRVDEICDLGRERVISQEDIQRHSGIYPVFSSQSKDDGVFGFLDSYDFEGDYATWTTDGANAGTVFFRTGRFNCTNVCGTLKPKSSSTNARFLARALSVVTKRHVSYVGNPKLMNNVMAAIQILLPPRSVQDYIAAVLDTVDEAITKTEAVIAKLKQVRAGLLHDLLTHGLDRHGQLRDPITHPEQFHDSPLGRIPREWAVLTIEALLARVPNALRSGPFGSALLKQELKESGIPLLGIDNVHIERFVANYTRFVDDDKFVELRQYTVRAGDVMITIMGTVGRCCVVPDSIGIALSSKHVWTITLDRSRYSPHVTCWQMNFAPWVLRQFKRDEQGGVMTAIRSETLRQLLLPVPPLPEMQAIETMLLQFNKRIGEEEALLAKLAALKSGLMSDLLTGRVRVPEEIAVAL